MFLGTSIKLLNFTVIILLIVLKLMTMELIDKLKKQLLKPLPGRTAHKKMKPVLPNGKKFPELEPQNAIKSAVLILLYRKDKNWHFPLIQRPIYDGVHSGQIAFPGGKEEETDTNLIATAIREANEEVGISVEKVNVVGELSDFFVPVSNHLIRPVIGYCQDQPIFIPDRREVDHVIEVPLHQLLDTTLLKEKEITAASGYKLVSPYFELENKVVWGATAMMLSEFVEVLNDIEVWE